MLDRGVGFKSRNRSAFALVQIRLFIIGRERMLSNYSMRVFFCDISIAFP